MNDFEEHVRPIPIARPIPSTVHLVEDESPEPPVRRRRRRPDDSQQSHGWLHTIASGIEWLFGLVSLMIGLAILAAIPILQILSLGYLLECGGRIARTGSFRAGFIGIRPAARLGGMIFASWLLLLPVRFVADLAHSAAIIDPGGTIAQRWRIGLAFLIGATAFHILTAIANGGKIRHFLSPFNVVFVLRKIAAGGFYQQSRDAVWATLISLRLPYYFKLGFRGFAVAMIWLIVPVTLIAAGRANIALAPVLGVLGGILLAFVVLYLPFLQMRLAQSGRWRAAFELRTIRQDYRKAPWSFSFAFVTTLLFAMPLYLLKIEVVPREAAWLPSLVFILFIYPSRLLTGWALARASRRHEPCHWFFRWTGRIPLLPVAAFYGLVVFFTQYTSWNGLWSLYEQHAFSLPVPFFSL